MVTLSRQKQRSALSILTIIRASIAVAAAIILILFHYVLSDDDGISKSVLLDHVPQQQQQHHQPNDKNNGPAQPLKLNQAIVAKLATADDARIVPKSKTTTTTAGGGGMGGAIVPKATVAYAWTLAKCSDFQSSTEGMIDAALILKHSVHQVSSRVGKSQYDYHMYVLVHKDAASCTQILEDAGYTVKVLPQPVDKEQIQSPFLRKTVDREWCCGSKEFIKLYSYTLFEHPIVVHVDIDFAFFQPMDELFDAMLLDTTTSSSSSSSTRNKDDIVTAYPMKEWPTNIEAYITRDYQQLVPGDKRSLFQAGFMIVKPNQQVFDELVQVIIEGNFVEGWKNTSGWGGLGYAGKVGAKAMQGLIAYYYDVLRPNVSVELHGCYYNWMGGDILYRDVPAFYPQQYPDLVGKCRNGKDVCEDCQKAPIAQIRSVHYTNCRKPWNCIGVKWVKGQDKKAQGIDERNTNFNKCMEVIDLWHQLRTEMEDKVIQITGNHTLAKLWRGGDYMKSTFHGHCTENGQAGYIPLSGAVSAKLFQDIYN